MKVGVFLLGIGIVTILSLAAFVGLLFYFDPSQADVLVIILVFLTLLFGLAGLLTLVIFFFRRQILGGGNLVMRDAMSSFWQGSMIALAVVGILALLSRI